ncbi:hypothetical protein Tsubulata_030145, partial [Turnera subulata]
VLIMSSSGAVNKRKREECGDYNRLLVDEAKSTNTEQLVISTNMTAPNRSYLPADIVEEILDLLPLKSIERFRSVSKSLFSLMAIKFNVQKLLYYPCKEYSSPPNYSTKSSDDDLGTFIGVVLSDYCGRVKDQEYTASQLSGRERNYYRAYGFGYDSASDDYKEYLRHILTVAMGLFLNGAHHWGRPARRITTIFAFDLGKEKFYRVPNPPNEISPDRDVDYSVG